MFKNCHTQTSYSQRDVHISWDVFPLQGLWYASMTLIKKVNVDVIVDNDNLTTLIIRFKVSMLLQ